MRKKFDLQSFLSHLELVVLREAEQVAALHREQVLHRGLADADHGVKSGVVE
jgi:hypothetical protein